MRALGRAVTGTAVVALLALAACSADGDPTSAPTSHPPPSSSSPPAAASTAPTAPTAVVTSPTSTSTSTSTSSHSPDAVSQLVVVGHATRPQLDLDAATRDLLVSGELATFRGRRVVASSPPAGEAGDAGAVSPARAVRAVERDPGALAVVPLSAVGPTVAVARVDGVDPVRDDPGATHLTVVGDVMLTRGVDDPAAALAPLSRRLRGADITAGNLESTLSTDGEPTQGGDSFGASPALLGPLEAAGFDALSLANNHAGDYGTAALLETVATMRDSPIDPFGAGRNATDAGRPAIVERHGVRFGFVGFNAIGETLRAAPGEPGALSVRMPPRTGPLVPADLDRVATLIRRTAARVDVTVVLPHWGTQYTHVPEPVQRQVSRALVTAGADLVVGGHPHWVQGVDVVRGVPVLHSLGNFVFDMDFMTQTMEGAFLEATYWGDELKAMRLVPYRMSDESFAPRAVRGDAAAGILADVWSTSTGPFAP